MAEPILRFAGCYFATTATDQAIGPFPGDPGASIALGYSVHHNDAGAQTPPAIVVRPVRRKQRETPAPTCLLMLSYEHGGGADDIVFVVRTDSGQALAGAWFALDVESTHPGIAMAIARTAIDRDTIVARSRGQLPQAYRAQLQLKYWAAQAAPSVGASLAVQVGVATKDGGHSTLAELVFYPAPPGARRGA